MKVSMWLIWLCCVLEFSTFVVADENELTKANFLERYQGEASQLMSEYSECVIDVSCITTDVYSHSEQRTESRLFIHSGNVRLDQ